MSQDSTVNGSSRGDWTWLFERINDAPSLGAAYESNRHHGKNDYSFELHSASIYANDQTCGSITVGSCNE